MSTFEYDEEKEMRLFREAERAEGCEMGKELQKKEDLRVLVSLMKKFLPDVDAIYQMITEKEVYKDCTREQILELYN